MTMADTVDNPFFARLWTRMSTREPESIRRLRRENLAGLTGRVLEVGAGTGTNFAFYPATVTEVVAVEPERRLAEIAQRAADTASVPVTVTTDTVEEYRDAASRSTPSCARWCCARSTTPTAFCGNCSRCCDPAASCATSSTSRSSGPRARLQKAGRRDGVAAAARQLPHPPRHRAVDRRRGLRGRREPATSGCCRRGCRCRSSRDRDRPGGQAGVARRPSRAARAAAAAAPGSAVAAVSRSDERRGVRQRRLARG